MKHYTARQLARALLLIVPLALVLAGSLLPLPRQVAIGVVVMGVLLYQGVLFGAFDAFLPSSRKYLAMRAETERMLELVRRLNWAAVEAREAGRGLVDPPLPEIVDELHTVVELLPSVAGKATRGRAIGFAVRERESHAAANASSGAAG